MRKSTVMMMAILMLCFGTLLVAAGVLSKPLKQDAQLSKELTKLLLYQEVIEPGTKVDIFRRPAAKNRTLAQEGRGVVVRLSPAAKIRKRGGVRVILARIVSQLRDGLHGAKLDWIEFRLDFEETPDDKPFRTLLTRTAGGGFTSPKPAV